MSRGLYKQGEIILIRYPLSDKPEKSIIRPVVIVSNESSNNQDWDVLACQITTRLRQDIYSYAITNDKLTAPMPEPCEVRCNKIATIRVWDKIVLNKISELTPNALIDLLNIVRTVF